MDGVAVLGAPVTARRVVPALQHHLRVHSSPAVVNHEALRRHDVIPIWEAYDETA